MKKARFLPAILMLILSVAIMGVGIYAASAKNHTIIGSITVKVPNAEVTIEAWIEGDNNNPHQIFENIRGGDKEFTFNGVKLDMSTANKLGEVKTQTILVKITNHSSRELGAYFFDEESAEDVPEEATYENIFHGETFKGLVQGVEKDVAGVTISSYAHIGKTSDSAITDETIMSLTFYPMDWIDETKEIEFDYQLVIEEYKANVNTESIQSSTSTEGEATTSSNFIKLSSSYGAEKTARNLITTTSGFENMKSVEDLIVVIPNSVTEIATATFKNFTNLKAVTLPNSLTTLNNEAFYGCAGLKNIVIPSSITTFGDGVFAGCLNLKSIVLNDDLTIIGSQAFASTGVNGLYIPKGVTNIGANAFGDCLGLMRIVIEGHGEGTVDTNFVATLPTTGEKVWYLNDVLMTDTTIKYSATTNKYVAK